MYQSKARPRRAPRMALALGVACAALAVAILPVSATGFTAPKTLASPDTYWISGVGSEGRNVVVGWLRNGSQLFYRVSTNRGWSFAPAVNLGAANPGALTICGGLVVAVRLNSGAGSATMDVRGLDGAIVSTTTLASGRDLSLTGNAIACVGGRQIATAWDEWINGRLHLKVAVAPIAEALPTYEFDLGAAHLYRVRQIAATDEGIWTAWAKQHTIIVQKLNVANDATRTVTLGRRTQVARFVDAPGANVAVSGSRVYAVYASREDAMVKISNDGGRTFGRAKLVYDTTPDQPADIFGINAAENVVAASIHLGPWCGGCVGTNRTLYSSNWGRTWLSGPVNEGGYMGVGLFGAGAGMRIAQAWDNRTSHESLGDPGYVKFSTGKP